MKTLFVCVENAGRSQIAQALYERRGGEARSAGSRPAAELHEAVVEALEEVGIDISGRKPKALVREDVEWADLVVTMGCGDARTGRRAGSLPCRRGPPRRGSGTLRAAVPSKGEGAARPGTRSARP